MDNTNPEVGTEASTLPADSAVDNILSANLDGILGDTFEEAMQGIMDLPSAEAEVAEDNLEVSEDDEQTPSDDDSNIDEDDEQEETESEEEDTSDSVVDWDEMRQHTFEIDGKTYSANDLKAALGRQSKQEEARNEVETARAEIAAEREMLEAQKASIEVSQATVAHRQQMAQLENAKAHLQNEQQKALAENDSHNLAIVNTRLQQVEAAMNKTSEEARQMQHQAAAYAAQQLSSFGYGDLVTDAQRQSSFVEYASANVPANLVNIVDTSPELLVMVEKARLYDKANSEIPKGKLKSSRKTLKGGAAKTAKKKTVDQVTQTVDTVIEDMFKNF